MTDIRTLGIRRIGITIAFHAHYKLYGKYPENADELHRVTATELLPHHFDKYKRWFDETRPVIGGWNE